MVAARRGLEVAGTRGCAGCSEAAGPPGADGVPAEVPDGRVEGPSAVGRGCGRRSLGGAGTTVCPVRVRVRDRLVGEGGSREVAVALGGVADQTGAERGDPGESSGHAVAVGVTGDQVVGE